MHLGTNLVGLHVVPGRAAVAPNVHALGRNVVPPPQPRFHRAFIQTERDHHGLQQTTMRQQRQNQGHQVFGFMQAMKHRDGGLGKSLVAHLADVTMSLRQ